MKECWYCHRENKNITDDYIGDFDCEFCLVQNSCYEESKPDWKPENQTTEEEWLNTEEEMAIDYGDEKYQGKFIYMPRIGETLIIEIKELREVKSDNPKFNFSENVPVMINGEPGVDDEGEPLFKKKDLGYHIEAELVNGKILSITSMSAFIQVFKKNEINDGDKVRIFHKDKGVWEVEKL